MRRLLGKVGRVFARKKKRLFAGKTLAIFGENFKMCRFLEKSGENRSENPICRFKANSGGFRSENKMFRFFCASPCDFRSEI